MKPFVYLFPGQKIESIEFYLAWFSYLTTTFKKSLMPKTRYFFKQIFYRDVTECLIKQERIFFSETNHRSALFSSQKTVKNRTEFWISGIISGRDLNWDIIITFTVIFRPRAFISYPYRLYLTKFLKMAPFYQRCGISYRFIQTYSW